MSRRREFPIDFAAPSRATHGGAQPISHVSAVSDLPLAPFDEDVAMDSASLDGSESVVTGIEFPVSVVDDTGNAELTLSGYRFIL